MSRQLPDRPNLEHLRKQAKELLVEMQRQDPTSKLADALHAVAREYGFSSWPALKTHVAFAGQWTADMLESAGLSHARGARFQFAVAEDSVTITYDVVNASGREERTVIPIRVDGREHPTDFGYTVAARWLGSRVLDVLVNKQGARVGHARYEVSPDGATLTVGAGGTAHDGYPAIKRLVVLNRSR